MYPNEETTYIARFSYFVINKLTKHSDFRQNDKQHNLAMDVILNVLADNEVMYSSDFCDGGHCTEKIEKMVLWACSNALLNNYC